MDFEAIPTVTKYTLISMIVCSALGSYWISPYYLIFSTKQIFTRLQVWRLGTGLIFSGVFRSGFIFSLLLAYFALSQIEIALIEKKGDFYYLLLICCSLSAVIKLCSLLRGALAMSNSSTRW
jgi:hypothetical protein